MGGLLLLFTLIMVGAWLSSPSEVGPVYSYDFDKLTSVKNIDSLRTILKNDTLIEYLSKPDNEEPTDEQKKIMGNSKYEWSNDFNIRKNNVECVVWFYPNTRKIKEFFISSRNTDKERDIENDLDMAVAFNLDYASKKYSIKKITANDDKDMLLALTITPKITEKEIKENREKAEKELATFKKSEDEFNRITFYKDSRIPEYSNVNFISPYIGKQDDQYWLRLKLQYAAEDWLFIEKGIFLVDGEQYTISGKWERDNNSEIWEWLDMQVSESERPILDKIANSKSAKVRYEGKQYHNDRTISQKEKDIIKKTLDIYDNLNIPGSIE